MDFGAQSAVPLLDKYENLLIVQTTSKVALARGHAHRLCARLGDADFHARSG